MDASTVFTQFITDLKSAFPTHVSSETFDVEKTIKEIETNFFPHVMPIIQKNSTFFDEPRRLFGIDLSDIWIADGITEKSKECIWKHLQSCLVASFLHGDMKDKLTSILELAKNVLGDRHAGITNILNDEGSQEKIKKIIEFISETRTAKAIMKVVESIDLSELNVEFETPEELMAILQNPEHPAIQSMMTKIRTIFKEKINHGQLTQHVMMTEIEEIKSMAIGLFGDSIYEMMGIPKKPKAERPVVNTPAGRAQYMRDRLRRKLEEKYKNQKN
jgi:hypothetical protein